MGIYIKSMKMPKICGICMCYNADDDGAYCFLSSDIKDVSFYNKPKDCPLIEIPPHGDLIDRDALLKKCEFVCTDDDVDVRAVRYSVIDAAPTIIPAEEGET